MILWYCLWKDLFQIFIYFQYMRFGWASQDLWTFHACLRPRCLFIEWQWLTSCDRPCFETAPVVEAFGVQRKNAFHWGERPWVGPRLETLWVLWLSRCENSLARGGQSSAERDALGFKTKPKGFSEVSFLHVGTTTFLGWFTQSLSRPDPPWCDPQRHSANLNVRQWFLAVPLEFRKTSDLCRSQLCCRNAAPRLFLLTA